MSDYYAVKNGRIPGVYTDWKTTEAQVKGFSGAIYKKFPTKSAALAFLEGSEEESESDDDSSSESEDSSEKLTGIVAYVDGSCVDKVGGYAFLVIDDEEVEEFYGKVPDSPCTNNIAELYAIYKCLKYLIKKEYKSVTIRPDSRYAMDSVSKFIKKWKRNGWKTAKDEPVKNQELIKKIDALLAKIEIEFVHVKGHGKNEFNRRVDQLANEGRLK